MVYEVETIAPSVTPTDASLSSSPGMREERVFEPYRQRPIPKALSDVGQLNTNDATKPASVDPAKPVTAETVTLSPQMAALARKEQAFRRQQQELKAQMSALESERAEIAEMKAIKAKLDAKDFSAIENLVPYNDYSQYLIEKGTSVSPEQQELKRQAAEIAAIKEAQKTDVDKRFEAAVQERRTAVLELVESNPEFKRIKGLKQQEAVVQHILDTWEHDDTELSVEQAAKEVEEALLEQGRIWTSVMNEEARPTEVEDKRQLPPLKPGIKTLTNEMTIQGDTVRPKKSFQGMTEAERFAEARRRAEEKLKKG